jgi:hypothetical protein
MGVVVALRLWGVLGVLGLVMVGVGGNWVKGLGRGEVGVVLVWEGGGLGVALALEHWALPGALVELPGQARHKGLPWALQVVSGHIAQAVLLEAGAAYPAAQGVQVGLLGKGEKVPGGHRVHASPRLAPPTAPAA